MKKRIALLLLLVTIILTIPSVSLAKQIKFAVLSDVHYAVDGKDKKYKMLKSVKRIAPKLLEEISERDDIDFVIFTGDLFVDPYYPELGEFKKVLASNLTKPWFVIPGNHDRAMDKHRGKGVFTLEEFVTAFRGHPYRSDDRSWWSLDFEGYHLIGLDSTMYNSWGGDISPEQIKWLKKDLRKNRKKFTIIFLHHPVVRFQPGLGIDEKHYLGHPSELEDILLKNRQVKFVVAGHVHLPSATIKDGVHHFTAPSIITYACKYAVFTVDDDEVTLETIRIDDPKLVKKAKREIVKQKNWRENFASDEDMTTLFEGFNLYSFVPR